MCKRFVFLFLGLFISLGVFSKDEIPVAKQLVTDQSGVLQAEQLQQLERKLEAYNDSTSTQIAIVLQETTNGRDPYDYAMDLAKNWGIGQKDKNNGVLIFVATGDRKIRILTGRGIEDRLPDAICKRIINRILKPALKVGDYYGGLDAATDEMMARASGAFVNDEEPDGGGVPLVFIFIIVFFIVSIIGKIINRNNRGGGNNSRGGGMFFPPIFMGGGRDWGDSGGGWGSSGGGFGGFGGGSFGGGGAGGDF